MTLVNDMWEMTEQEKCEHKEVDKYVYTEWEYGLEITKFMCKKCKLVLKEMTKDI
jgi:hypothetical protein